MSYTNPGDKEAETKFKEIQEAYEVLSDPEKRKRYDELGADWKAGADFRPPPRGYRQTVDVGDLGDFFSAGGGNGFSDFFETLFGGRRRGSGEGARFRMRGRDIQAEVPVTLEEAYHDTRRSLSLEVDEPCSACGGSGIKGNEPCPVCRGRGAVPRTKTLEVTIPAGVRDGTVLRLAGQGEASPGGGEPGDLLVHIRLRPHPRFSLVGIDDLLMTLPVAPWEAVLGTRALVDTLDGKVELSIPPGSQNGQKLRMRGQGLRRRDGSRGDLYVQLAAMVPTSPSPEEKELFKKLAAVSSFKPR